MCGRRACRRQFVLSRRRAWANHCVLTKFGRLLQTQQRIFSTLKRASADSVRSRLASHHGSGIFINQWNWNPGEAFQPMGLYQAAMHYNFVAGTQSLSHAHCDKTVVHCCVLQKLKSWLHPFPCCECSCERSQQKYEIRTSIVTTVQNEFGTPFPVGLPGSSASS